MMPSEELFAAKARLVRSAELALAISGLGGEEKLEFEPREYAEAIACLASMPDDLSAVLAELDVLRGMFDESVKNFLTNGISKEGRNDAGQKKPQKKKDIQTATDPEQTDASVGEAGADVRSGGAVSGEQPVSGGESEQDDNPPTNSRPRGRRGSGKRTPRPKSGGDQRKGEAD